MWVAMKSTILISTDLAALSDAALAILSNAEALAIHQDAWGIQARRASSIWDWARPRHTASALRPGSRHATSAPGLGPPHATSALGPGPPLPHLHQDWARPVPHLHWDRARP